MAIKWLTTQEKNGVASLYNTNITLNTVASVPFQYAYRCQVGVTDDNNIVIEPLSKERVIKGDLDEYAVLKLSVNQTYSRISSTTLMSKIAEFLGKELTDKPLKFETTWDEKENILTIMTNKEV